MKVSTAMKLYDLERSGNGYKVRLMLALLGLPYESIRIDLPKGEHKHPDFLALNPFGEIPVFCDGEVVLRDSQAILVYLARAHGGETWLPSDPASMARVTQWLSTAANDIARGPADARRHDLLGYDIDIAKARAQTVRVISIMEKHLSGRDWLELGRPTIADICCFPYIALSYQGGVPLDDHPNVRAWIARVKALPGFVAMAGIA
jgi:glutathione S-transferase